MGIKRFEKIQVWVKAKDLGKIDEETFDELFNNTLEIFKMISGLVKTLK